ncbi:hypothetical protein [Nocardia wallacei]|uniref:hypothetical protein n=1 Tax=Nocardia wallacei TaxID=480035 RepID=UPI002455087A|nr:hypothetical protein [Nocardia wallacei]
MADQATAQRAAIEQYAQDAGWVQHREGIQTEFERNSWDIWVTWSDNGFPTMYFVQDPGGFDRAVERYIPGTPANELVDSLRGWLDNAGVDRAQAVRDRFLAYAVELDGKEGLIGPQGVAQRIREIAGVWP